MKKIIKYSNYFVFTLALCVIIISGCSCSTTKQDPLVGFHTASKNPEQAVVNDYQDYIQKLSSAEKKYLGPILYYEDGRGQYVITFEVDKHGKDVWDHYLFYDKDGKRTKVIKYYRGQYWNP
jgi:hypothetical protein